MYTQANLNRRIFHPIFLSRLGLLEKVHIVRCKVSSESEFSIRAGIVAEVLELECVIISETRRRDEKIENQELLEDRFG